MSLFRKKLVPVNVKTDYPSGVALVTTSGKSYLVKGQGLLKIDSTQVFDSWNFNRVVKVTDNAISHYPIFGKLGFRDGTVLKSFGSRKIYLVSQQKLRHITDPNVLTALQVRYEDIVQVADSVIEMQKVGEPIGSIQAGSLAAK